MAINQPTHEDLTQDPRGALIAARRVNGTEVFGADEVRIGEIEDLMLDKRLGSVEYAVLSFGGFLGIGSKHYALPWRMLRYEPRLGGFIVNNITRERLEAAPAHEPTGDWATIDQYWGM